MVLCMALSFAGCKSMIKEAADEASRRAEAQPIALKDMYSEAGGYHFPGYQWGDSFAEFQKVANYPISNIAGYGEDCTYYDAEGWHILLGDYVNDSATVGMDDSEYIRMISFEFAGGNGSISATGFDGFAAVIEANLGTATEVTEKDGEDQNGTKFTYKTYFWRATLENGLETSLQWGSATIKGTRTPFAVTFSLGCRVPEKKE